MTSQELYDYAASLLAKRDYASGELMRILNKLTEDREGIDKALSLLVECGYSEITKSEMLYSYFYRFPPVKKITNNIFFDSIRHYVMNTIIMVEYIHDKSHYFLIVPGLLLG